MILFIVFLVLCQIKLEATSRLDSLYLIVSNVTPCLSQIVMWLNQNFLLPKEVVIENNELDVKFLSLRTETPLGLKMTSNGEVCIMFLFGRLVANCFRIRQHDLGHV